MKTKHARFSIEKLMQHSSDIIGCIDQNSYILSASNACESIIGYKVNELVGRPYTDFLHPDDIADTIRFIQSVAQHGKQGIFENRYVHKDGHLVPVRWTVAWCEADGTLFFMGYDITEQQANQQRLIESEQRYKVLFETSPEILFVENKDGQLTEANEQFKRFFRMQGDSAIGRTAATFLTDNCVALNEKYLQQAFLGSTVQFDLEVETQQETRVFDTIKQPIMVNGEIIAVQTIAKDITPILRSHKTISQQAKKLNTTFESITDAFYTLDRQWNISYLNTEAERLLCLKREIHLGQNIWCLFPEEVGGVFYQYYHYSFQTGEASHFEAFFAGGDMWVEVKVFPSEEGLSVYFSDISEKLRIRKELEKLSLVASKTNNGVIIADRDYRIEWVNDGFTRLTGYNAGEAFGRKPSELLHNSKTDKSAFISHEDRLNDGEPISFEILNVTKAGDEIWVSSEVTALFDEKGDRSGYIEVMTDITVLKNSQQDLTTLTKDLYKKNNDLLQFTYIVSHNLRAPVANALGLSNVVAKTDKASPLFDQSLRYLNQTILQLDTVLRDLNTILTIRDDKYSLEKEQVDLNTVLQQVIASFQEQLQHCGGIVLTRQMEGISVQANKAYLYSVFHNLLSNAIKYRSAERTLQVRIECMTNAQTGVVISVADNGTGFDLTKAGNNVFKLYKRFHTERKGRGIGLYLVDAHLKAMDGQIEVTSHVGIGTKFIIHLRK
jgi:PAS domain S-box-containing protein